MSKGVDVPCSRYDPGEDDEIGEFATHLGYDVSEPFRKPDQADDTEAEQAMSLALGLVRPRGREPTSISGPVPL